MPSEQKVLFIGHDATRTGAPLILLNLLRWIRENSPLSFEILLRDGGPLLEKFSAVAPTRVLAPGSGGRVRRLVHRLGGRQPPEAMLPKLYPAGRFPLVYANTVTTGALVRALAAPGRTILCHAHEMRVAMERWGGPHLPDLVRHTDLFIACSGAVKRDLTAVLVVPEAKIEVVYEFGQRTPFTTTEQAAARHRIRTELGYPDDAIVVGMCGTTDWRKGADLFPPLARTVARLRPGGRFRFLWIGSNPKSNEFLQIQHDLRQMGVDDVVRYIASVPNPHEYLSAIDLFALTSREDPFPLVMLEAAALGKPILCFERSGGAAEFIEHGAGLAVPYLDVGALADAVVALGEDNSRRAQMSEQARSRAEGISLATQAPQLLRIINRYVKSQN